MGSGGGETLSLRELASEARLALASGSRSLADGVPGREMVRMEDVRRITLPIRFHLEEGLLFRDVIGVGSREVKERSPRA